MTKFLSKDGKLYMRDGKLLGYTPMPEKGKKLNEYTWAEIRQISDANKATEYGFKPGDTKSITISGTIGNTTVNQTIDTVILGINHNAEKEGNNRIHFLIGKPGKGQYDKRLYGMTDSQYDTAVSTSGWCSMNTSNTNNGGWKGSYMRQTFLGNTGTPTEPIENTFLAALPADLRAEMKSCTKYSDNTGGNTSLASAVTATTDYLFLLSETEVVYCENSNPAEQNNQMRYDYFKEGNFQKAGSWGDPATTVDWWLRSVRKRYDSYFCCITAQETNNVGYSVYSKGVLPGFCI